MVRQAPPYSPKVGAGVSYAFSGPFALATGVAGTAGGLGKGSSMGVVLVLPVSSLRVHLPVGARPLLLTGVSGELPDVSANWLAELGLLLPCAGRFGMRGGMQGLVDEGIIGSCSGLVEHRVQECGGEDGRGGW